MKATNPSNKNLSFYLNGETRDIQLGILQVYKDLVDMLSKDPTALERGQVNLECFTSKEGSNFIRTTVEDASILVGRVIGNVDPEVLNQYFNANSCRFNLSDATRSSKQVTPEEGFAAFLKSNKDLATQSEDTNQPW